MWFSWKVELCGEYRLTRGLDFHVNMACATRVFAWDYGFQVKAPLFICELMAAQPEPAIVVIPVAIRLPEVQSGMSNRVACGRKHISGDRQRRSHKARFS